ncbi:hypothetical protein [Marinobacter sp. F4206]|uniref:hypothetical protein n=1 Tax=Marinobacter sp. F4206 TaxID=2861777 RepID=UPI001C5FB0E5|nr:hypothetical protein [Marinobacter sp. F4206]MBW4934361.1 hypothetical protein [Marinobacter sp. F4206]
MPEHSPLPQRITYRGCSVSLMILALVVALQGCANWSEEAGVENTWRSESTPTWEPGTTTADDVINALGPPSQLINLRQQAVYYYMREQVTGEGYFLLLYNRSSKVTRYDRAVFFFDEDGLLQRYAYSKETLPDDS